MLIRFLFFQAILGLELSRHGYAAYFIKLKSSLHVCFVNEHSTVAQKFYPRKRNANDLSGKVEEMAGDIQYLMQAFTGLEDRLSKIEGSGADQGFDPK